jgi:hypothetical protein
MACQGSTTESRISVWFGMLFPPRRGTIHEVTRTKGLSFVYFVDRFTSESGNLIGAREEGGELIPRE